jgi:hypothetical protein
MPLNASFVGPDEDEDLLPPEAQPLPRARQYEDDITGLRSTWLPYGNRGLLVPPIAQSDPDTLDGLPHAAPFNGGPMVPPAAANEYGGALDRLKGLVNRMPVRQEPKWWQRALGGVAGAAAGVSNAAGRTRNPIDIGAMRESILQPGYDSKLRAWQSRVIPAQEIANIEAQKVGAGYKAAEEGRKVQESQADIAYKQAHANYMNGLGRGQLTEVTPEMEEATGGVFRAGTRIPSSTVAEIARISAGKYEKPEARQVVSDPAMAKKLGVKVGDSVAISTYNAGLHPPAASAAAAGKPISVAPGASLVDSSGKLLYNNPKAAKEADPLVEEMRKQRMEEQKNRDIEGVGTAKSTREAGIIAKRDAEVQKLMKAVGVDSEQELYANNTPALRAINRKFAGQLQAVHDQFTSAARRRGIEADDFDVDPDTLEYKPRAAKGAAAQAPVAPAPAGPAAPGGQAAPLAAAPPAASDPNVNPHPGKPWQQRRKVNGAIEFRHSLDDGKTWLPGRAPTQA